MEGLGISFQQAQAMLLQQARGQQPDQSQPAHEQGAMTSSPRRPLPTPQPHLHMMRRAMSHDQLRHTDISDGSEASPPGPTPSPRRARFADTSPLVLNAHELLSPPQEEPDIIQADDVDSDNEDPYEALIGDYHTSPEQEIFAAESPACPPTNTPSSPPSRQHSPVKDTRIASIQRQANVHRRGHSLDDLRAVFEAKQKQQETTPSETHSDPAPSSRPIPSQRQLLNRRLNRPQSMMELSHLVALQSLQMPGNESSQGFRAQQAASEEHSVNTPPSATMSDLSGASGASFTSAGELAALRRVQSTVSMRSAASMRGLESAEAGGAAVALDTLHHSFDEGVEFNPDEVDRMLKSPDVIGMMQRNTTSQEDQFLTRQSTLLSAGANATKRQRELNRILTPSNSKNTSNAKAAPVQLEQAKAKARVELDVLLDSVLIVEGGSLTGRMEIRTKAPSKDDALYLSLPKVRVVGFEEIANTTTRHVFYHYAEVITTANGLPLPCFDASVSDNEGFRQSRPGVHAFPFQIRLPQGKGAKGSLRCKQGNVRYIVIGSIGLKGKADSTRSIAHFYRQIDLFPYLDPAEMLSSAPKPISASHAKSLFLGGEGKVELTASVHRENWVAGQLCYVTVDIKNESTKKIRTMTLSLARTTTVFRPRPYLTLGSGVDADDPKEVEIDADACQTHTSRKIVAESTIDTGKKGQNGEVTAKGMWMGVERQSFARFQHSLALPGDALSIIRGRHLEVIYHVKVSIASTLASDVAVELPIRIINFVSLDPPPCHVPVSPAQSNTTKPEPIAKRPQTNRLQDLKAPAMHRAHSMPSLREEAARQNPHPHPQPQHPQLARPRQLVHQQSLDRISSAIASATARREQSDPASNPRLQNVLAANATLVNNQNNGDTDWQAEIDCVFNQMNSGLTNSGDLRGPEPTPSMYAERQSTMKSSFTFATPNAPIKARVDVKQNQPSPPASLHRTKPASPLKSAMKLPRKETPLTSAALAHAAVKASRDRSASFTSAGRLLPPSPSQGSAEYLSPPSLSPAASSPSPSDISTPSGSIIIKSPSLSPGVAGGTYDWQNSQQLFSPALKITKVRSVPNIGAIARSQSPQSVRARVKTFDSSVEYDSQRSSRAYRGSPLSEASSFASPARLVRNYSATSSFNAPILRPFS